MEYEKQLTHDIGGFTHDPLGFVYYAFPWGEKELAEFKGPDTWQRELLTRIGDQLKNGKEKGAVIQEAVSTGHGVGKAQRMSREFQRLIVRDKKAVGIESIVWGDLKAGDYVFGKNGKPIQILQVHHQGVRPVYRVTFDDGSFTDCDEEHLWKVKGRKERRLGVRGWRTLSTTELIELGIQRSNGTGISKQWEIPIQDPVEFVEKPVYDPYTIGVWLAGGSLLKKIAPNMRTLKDALKRYDLLQVSAVLRSIPEDYKINSISTRKLLLSGLFDSGATIIKTGSINFKSISKQMLNDVAWLVRSLGGKAKITKHSCSINFENWNPFTEEKKKKAFKDDIKHRYICRWINTIEYLCDEPTSCITVDAEDSLYLTNDFVVTHNSALVSWLILWAMSTCRDTRGVVTANTEKQLRTKTWAEFAKWNRLCLTNHWFHKTATSYFSKDAKYEDTWRFDVIPWSDKNTEAFAGLHNKGSRILAVFDEASAIDDLIWEVAEGAMTDKDTEIIWCVFGNPTVNTGRFRECFGRFRHRWGNIKVDSRNSIMTNKEKIQQWIEDYGIQSDFVKVRVLGEFPSAGTDQFIPTTLVEAAQNRTVEVPFGAPKLMGLDPARFGEDSSVFTRVHGRKLEEIHEYKGLDTMQLAAKAAELIKKYNPDHFFIDAIGIGAGIFDRLKQLGFSPIEVISSQKAEDQRQFFNKRVEMWSRMRDWLKLAEIPHEIKLKDDLCGITYGHDAKSRLQLEKKVDMKRRGLSSPDRGDSLALLFAYETPPINHIDYEDLLPEYFDDF